MRVTYPDVMPQAQNDVCFGVRVGQLQQLGELCRQLVPRRFVV